MPGEDSVRSEASATENYGETYGLTPEGMRAVAEALRTGEAERVAQTVDDLHPAEIAALIASLTPEERRLFVDAMRSSLDPEILPELDEQIREEIVALLRPAALAADVRELDTDEATEATSIEKRR